MESSDSKIDYEKNRKLANDFLKELHETKEPKTQAHTEGKWMVDRNYPDKFILNKDKAIIVDYGLRKTAEGKANAKFIVKAVNSHQELVEALRKAKEDINWMLNTGNLLNGYVFDYIEQALKNAGEGE